MWLKMSGSFFMRGLLLLWGVVGFDPVPENRLLSNSSLDGSYFWNKIVPFTVESEVPLVGKSTLYFVHIPKTAGSSFERVLQELCDKRAPLCLRRFIGSELSKNKDGWYPIELIQSYPEDKRCTNERGYIVFGHIPLDVKYVEEVLIKKKAPKVVKPLPSSEVDNGDESPKTERRSLELSSNAGAPLHLIGNIFPVIMLREPVARVVSFANFLNIGQAMFEKHPERLSCNQQTSMINGVPGTGGGCGVGVTSQKKLWSSFVKFEGSCNYDPEEAVKEAIRRLNNVFYFVGVSEDFIGSMFILQRMFGWGTDMVKMSFEKSMKQFCDGVCMQRFQTSDLNSKTVELITNNEYRCDGPVWKHAKSLLEARLSAMSEKDMKDFALFEKMAKAQDKKRDSMIKMATQKMVVKKTRGVLKTTSLSLESLPEKNKNGKESVMDVTSALRLASASGILSKNGGLSSSSFNDNDNKVNTGTKSKVHEAILKSISTDSKYPSHSTSHHSYGICGDNAMLEVFRDKHKGDICRMKGSKEFYCPLGCRLASTDPNMLCSAASSTSLEPQPCRHRDISKLFGRRRHRRQRRR